MEINLVLRANLNEDKQEKDAKDQGDLNQNEKFESLLEKDIGRDLGAHTGLMNDNKGKKKDSTLVSPINTFKGLKGSPL